MLTGAKRFNVFFAVMVTLAAVSLCGCHTNKGLDKKSMAVISLHMETNPDMPDVSSPVPIYRENPMMINVDKTPFLTETDLAGAKIVEVLGGFAIQLQFNERSKWMLEQYTAANPGKRIAILCRWDEKLKESRWLAAPTVTRRISDGVLTFTPDATRAESEKMVQGLNKMAAEAIKSDNKW